MHDIAIIIPAFNAERTIAQTIQSVLNQTAPIAEIVVVDDGSTDQTAEIASGFSGKVKVIKKTNGGQGSARALGAAQTNSELLLFIDADDLLLPTAIEQMKDRLLNSPGASLVYCRASLFYEPNVAKAFFDYELVDYTGDVFNQLMVRNFIRTPGCALMRRDALIAAGGWDSDRIYRGTEDWDLWIRLSALGPVVRIDDNLLQYRIHATNFSSVREQMDRSHLFVVYKLSRIRWGNPAHRVATQARYEAVRDYLADIFLKESLSNWRSGNPVRALKFACIAVKIWPRCLGWPLRRLLK